MSAVGAHDLIRLSGLEEGVDVDITFSGVRPGEKLFEEVFFGHEAVGRATPGTHPREILGPIERAARAVGGPSSIRESEYLERRGRWGGFCDGMVTLEAQPTGTLGG